jgi:acetoin utilization protein AcuB
VRDTDDLAIATQLMLWASVHHLPVLDAHDQLIGVLSDRDILVRRTEAGHAADREPVRSALSAEPATVTPDQDVADAALRILGRGVSALAVCEHAGGAVIGVLTTTDFIQYLAAPRLDPARPGPTVRDIMHRNPVTVAADDHLMDALLRMADRSIRHLPVIAGDRRVIGMLSDRDIRTAIGDPSRAAEPLPTRLRLQALRVEDVMSHPAVTVPTSASLTEVAGRFIDQRIGALPVVDEREKLCGIVSYVDLLRAAFRDPGSGGVRRSVANHEPYLRRSDAR